MKGFLAAVIAVLLAAGGLAVALRVRPVEVRKVRTDDPALRPGQTEVTGVVTFVHAEGAVPSGGPLPLPLTLAKGGNATITSGRTTIAWDGGTPLVIEGQGQGGLDVAGATVEVGPDGFRWMLDGEPHAFAPGHYTVVGPVAVGTTGLATPRDRAPFDGPATITTRAGTAATAPLGPLTVDGPGAVRLEGRLRVRTTHGTTRTTAPVAFAADAYRLTLAPGPDGIVVTGLFQGRKG